jgi:hypothetical protein
MLLRGLKLVAMQGLDKNHPHLNSYKLILPLKSNISLADCIDLAKIKRVGRRSCADR